MNIGLGGDFLEIIMGALIAIALGLLGALPIGIAVYVAIRLALPRELFTKQGQKETGTGHSDEQDTK